MSATFAVMNPATGLELAQLPCHTVAQVLEMIELSVDSLVTWQQQTAYARAELLLRWHAVVQAQSEGLAQCISTEMGKPIREARGEVAYAASYILWYAEEAKRMYGTTVPSQVAHKRLLVQPKAVGVVYAITPWNFPAAMVTRKVAAALAAGCTVILKPAEQAPLSALLLQKLWQQVGGELGTFQVITTDDPALVSAPIFADPRVRKITFTGSTHVGQHLAAMAATTLKRVSLELGGHAPFIVFADADIEQAARDVVASKFRNAGQTCVCTNRLYVQAQIWAPFMAELRKQVSLLKMGYPQNEDTQIGPLVDRAAVDKVQRHIQDALSQGAQLECGGTVSGLYCTPTLLSGVHDQMQVMQEETFGPLLPVQIFTHEAEVVKAANQTPYGLAAYLWTRDSARAWRVSEALEYGIVGINDPVPSTAQAPFGGIKMSGYGREGGVWGLQDYLSYQYVSWNIQ